MDHDNIVKFKGWFEDENFFLIIMEYVPSNFLNSRWQLIRHLFAKQMIANQIFRISDNKMVLRYRTSLEISTWSRYYSQRYQAWKYSHRHKTGSKIDWLWSFENFEQWNMSANGCRNTRIYVTSDASESWVLE